MVDQSGYRIHERYDDFTLLNDVALLILPTYAYLTREVQLISLAYDTTANYMNYVARIGGWGRISDVTLEISNVLRFVEVSVISSEVCEKSFPKVITKGNICTASNQGKSACNGDSGAPLTITNWDGRYMQIGIVSFGSLFGCEQGAPVVYTKISEFMPFIIRNVK
jgi:secreted trypsin-like serine protease